MARDKEKVRAATMRSLAKNFEKLSLTLHKGTKAKYKAFAASRGLSLTAMITRYIDAEIEKAGFVYEQTEEDGKAIAEDE